MADDGGVAAKLAGAKKALESANNSNVSTKSGHPFGNDYAVVRAATKPKPMTPGEDVAHGLQANRDNVDTYVKATGGDK